LHGIHSLTLCYRFVCADIDSKISLSYIWIKNLIYIDSVGSISFEQLYL